MGQLSEPVLVSALIDWLTNNFTGDNRMGACNCLNQIGPPAAAAIPALRIALNDPDIMVRQQAKFALMSIDPEHDPDTSLTRLIPTQHNR